MRRPDDVVRSVLPLIALAVAAIAAAGCVRRYQEPLPTEPHALVKFRILHHARFGDSLDEALRLDGYDVAIPPGVPTEARLRAVRVRPVASRYRFVVDYFHTELRQRMEVRTESYSCGYGTNARTCTRTVTRMVTDRVHVTDAACESTVPHVPIAGAIYLVQFDFYGHGSCAARCFRQLDGPGGEFELLPCGPGEPPAVATSGSESPLAPSPYERPIELRSMPAEPSPPPLAPRTEGTGRDLAPPR